jgi:hypothetical protein
MGTTEIFYTFSLLVEIEGHFSHDFVTWDYKTQDRAAAKEVLSILGGPWVNTVYAYDWSPLSLLYGLYLCGLDQIEDTGGLAWLGSLPHKLDSISY